LEITDYLVVIKSTTEGVKGPYFSFSLDYTMLYHISIDTNKYHNPELYDSRTQLTTQVTFAGARSFLEEYVNRLGIQPISIHESHLPDRTQLICWYSVQAPPITRPAAGESTV
jgi:hypothetical protein